MVSEDVWHAIFKNLDDPTSIEQASKTARVLLERAGENAAAIAASLVPSVATLKTSTGQERALSLLQPYAPSAPEVVALALDMSNNEDASVRAAAAAVLISTLPNRRASARVFQLISDPDHNIRNRVMAAIESMEFHETERGAEAALRVIPDDGEREEAIQLLDQLERAVKMLQDLGLDQGQNLIVDDLILPKITELRKLFGATSASVEQVVEQRKHGVLSLGTLLGSAQALALATTAVANADEAAQTLRTAAENLSPVVDMFGRLL